MARRFITTVASFALLAAPISAFAASLGINLSLRVPIYCMVTHQPINFGSPVGAEGISLGHFSEFCNSPSGYRLVLKYTPGTLQGTRVTAGNEQIVLTGSGRALLSESAGPRIQERAISAAPGTAGFNTDKIELSIEVN